MKSDVFVHRGKFLSILGYIDSQGALVDSFDKRMKVLKSKNNGIDLRLKR